MKANRIKHNDPGEEEQMRAIEEQSQTTAASQCNSDVGFMQEERPDVHDSPGSCNFGINDEEECKIP